MQKVQVIARNNLPNSSSKMETGTDVVHIFFMKYWAFLVAMMVTAAFVIVLRGLLRYILPVSAAPAHAGPHRLMDASAAWGAAHRIHLPVRTWHTEGCGTSDHRASVPDWEPHEDIAGELYARRIQK